MTHTFNPHPKYPWFCKDCGYAPHEPLQHSVSDEHAQHENPKGLSPQGAGAAALAGRPNASLQPQTQPHGDMGELIKRLSDFGWGLERDGKPHAAALQNEAAQALHSLSQKLEEVTAERDEQEARADHWFEEATFEIGGAPHLWRIRAEAAETALQSSQAQAASLREALEEIADPELWPEQWHGDERYPTWIGRSHPADIAAAALSALPKENASTGQGKGEEG